MHTKGRAGVQEDVLAVAINVPRLPPPSKLVKSWQFMESKGGCSQLTQWNRLPFQLSIPADLITISLLSDLSARSFFVIILISLLLFLLVISFSISRYLWFFISFYSSYSPFLFAVLFNHSSYYCELPCLSTILFRCRFHPYNYFYPVRFLINIFSIFIIALSFIGLHFSFIRLLTQF